MALSKFDIFSRTKSNVAWTLSVSFAAFIIFLLLLVTGYLLVLGAGSLSLEFFTEIPSGNVVATRDAAGKVIEGIGGMKQALIGTIILIGMASVVGVPLGMLAGIYLSEYEAGGWLATPLRFICDVLAGVPSIVVGILGYELLVRPVWMGTNNAWAGAAALAFIMVPIIARTTEEMLRLVPNSFREAAIGLGATKAQTIRQVVLPAATGSLVTGVMLAIARVAGETAPLLFTALNSKYTPISLDASFPFVHVATNNAFPSLTVQIFNYATSPYVEQNKQAWAGIIVLIALIFVLNLAIRFAASRSVGKTRTS